MNKIILIGRMTKDADIKTAKEMAIAKFSVAVNRSKAEDGADFVPCIAFGKTAEMIEKYFPKGKQIALEGHWQSGSYDKDGTKVYTNECVVDRVEFIGSKETEKKEEAPSGFARLTNEDIPF